MKRSIILIVIAVAALLIYFLVFYASSPDRETPQGVIENGASKDTHRLPVAEEEILPTVSPGQEEAPSQHQDDIEEATPAPSKVYTYGYKIVDTNVLSYYNNNSVIYKPSTGTSFYGQDAQYQINNPSYTNNGDGTITDRVTGLMWQKDMGEKMTLQEASTKARDLNLGGHSDWRVPTIKELYSLIIFTGRVQGEKAIDFFIDTNYFNQPLGDEREIDAQTWSSTEYVGRTMQNDETIFGVNFVDGRIKGYPKYDPRTRQPNKMYFRLVRGNTD